MRRVTVIGITIFAMIWAAPATGGDILPWGQPSDMVAWEEFIRVAAPAGRPDGQTVEFETWASDQDIYQTVPAKWPAPLPSRLVQIQFPSTAIPATQGSFNALVLKCETPSGFSGEPGQSDFPPDGCIMSDVRRNWASFQYIVANGLESATGRANASANKLRVNFPEDAVEFKGNWARVFDVAAWLRLSTDQVRSKYYVREAFYQNGSKTEIALLSFHITSKQIKNWVWIDFENGSNPGRCDVLGCHDVFGAKTSDVQPNSTPFQKYESCEKTEILKIMSINAGIKEVWNNYCLKGTQINFTDSEGHAILLGNSVIERLKSNIDLTKSSCMSCHAYAAFNDKGLANTYIFSNLNNAPIGNVKLKNIEDYTENDFVWGIATQSK